MKGRPVGKKISQKKSRNAKKTQRGPFSLVRYCLLRGKLFWFSSLGQQVQFGFFLKFCGTFGRPILLTSDGLKKHYSRLFSQERRRLKMGFSTHGPFYSSKK